MRRRERQEDKNKFNKNTERKHSGDFKSQKSSKPSASNDYRSNSGSRSFKSESEQGKQRPFQKRSTDASFHSQSRNSQSPSPFFEKRNKDFRNSSKNHNTNDTNGRGSEGRAFRDFSKDSSKFGKDRPREHTPRDKDFVRKEGGAYRSFSKDSSRIDRDKPRKFTPRDRNLDKKEGGEYRSFSKGPSRFDLDKPREFTPRDRNFDKKEGGEYRSFSKDSSRFDRDKPREFTPKDRNFNKKEGGEYRSFSKDSSRFDRDKSREFTPRDRNFDKKEEGEYRSFSKDSSKFGKDRPRENTYKKFNNYTSDRQASNRRPPFEKGTFDPDKNFKRFNSNKRQSDEPFEYGQHLNPGKRPDYSEENLIKKIPSKKQAAIGHSSDQIRLNRYIANAGLCSRREADDLIASGQITVNGKEITEMGYQVKPTDVIKYGRKILNREKLVYVLLNKPKDFITTTEDPEGRRTVMELLSKVGPERIYPVGRLDRATTGLLLFTNDGELADKLAHPSNEIRKIYQAEIDKPISDDDFEKLSAGIELEDGFIKPDEVSIITPDKQVIGIEIHSGKNRVVRRIFEHLGYEVTKLDRTTYAGLTKKDLPRGNWRFLTEKEVIRLKYLQ